MIYRETSSNIFAPWSGERLADGLLLNPQDAKRLSAEELEMLGLFIPAETDSIPEGKVSAAVKVQRIDGVVKFVHDLQDEPPPPVPSVVSMRQARLALHAAGLYSQVNGAIASLEEPGRTSAEIEWEYATEMRRDHQLIAMIGAALGMTEPEIDELFVQAGAIA